ncbi:MAG: hypothetical protein SVT56_11555, partial [Chloroflexota bacterium]|nr:hypothetical protein [Chloroflexota bacterium]
MIQAAEIQAQGDIENALRLIDEAINMAKQANSLEHVVQWKQQRSLIEMGSSDDFSLFTNVMQESLDVYRQQENIAEQLNTLLNLAGIMIR